MDWVISLDDSIFVPNEKNCTLANISILIAKKNNNNRFIQNSKHEVAQTLFSNKKKKTLAIDN